MKPLVTVITPSYNHGKYLENTVKSIINQTYKNIEYIIIDDGSTDNSHQIIKDLAKQYPQIKYVLHNDNKGLLRMNEGVAMAKGEYITMLSSDDWFLPKKIEKQMNLFEKLDETYGVVYSGGYRYYEDTDKMVEPLTNKLMKRGNILKNLLSEPFFVYPITPIIKKECFIKYPFSPGYASEGEAIFFKIAIDYKFDYVDEPLVVMRDYSGNTGKNLYRMQEDNIRYLNDLIKLKNFPDQLKYAVNKRIGHTHFYNGWQMIRNYKDKHGWKLMNKALEYDKNYLLNPRYYLAFITQFILKNDSSSS